MATLYAANASELSEVLNSSSGGDTIVLADGNYGSISITQDFDLPVQIIGSGASFTGIEFIGASNVSLEGVDVTGSVQINGGSFDIGFSNSYVGGSMGISDAQNVSISQCGITTSGQKALIIGDGARNIEIIGNEIFNAESDIVQIAGDVKGVLIENNIIRDPIPTKENSHPDLIQLFTSGGHTPSDITIRSNLLFDDPATGIKGAQGIFLSDGLYENILVEQNLIHSTMTLGVNVTSAVGNVQILNNTLLGGILSAQEKGSWVGNDNGSVVFEGNIARAYYNPEGDVDFSKNYFFGYGDDAKSSVFEDPSDPSLYTSYIPKEGSAIDFGSVFGAQEFLSALTNGGFDGLVLPETTTDVTQTEGTDVVGTEDGQEAASDTTTENSDTTTENSDATTENSDTTTENSDATTENSDATTENSDATTENSDATTENSDTTTENSDATTENSDTTTESYDGSIEIGESPGAQADGIVDETTDTNNAPIVNGSISAEVFEGEEVVIDLYDYFSDPDGDLLNFYANVNSDLFDINQDTGILVVTPSNGDVGEYEFFLSASDGQEMSPNISAFVEVLETEAESTTEDPIVNENDAPSTDNNSDESSNFLEAILEFFRSILGLGDEKGSSGPSPINESVPHGPQSSKLLERLMLDVESTDINPMDEREEELIEEFEF